VTWFILRITYERDNDLIQDFFQRTLQLAAHIGSDPNDDDDIRLQKSLLVICAFLFMLAGSAWGLMYIFFEEPLAGTIPLSYSAFSLLSIIHFGRTRQYHFFRFSQLALILLLPFLLMMALGGFVNGSAVVLWALICPMGAMLFDEPRHAPRWFLAFVVLVVVSNFLQPYVRFTNNLSSAVVNFFFAINLIGVGSLVFLMVFYFVGQKNMFQQKSEALLLNILPKDIAARLKRGEHTIADNYESVSIMVVDLVDFTPLSAACDPNAMLEFLSGMFSTFDQLVEKYGVEKIETVGDSYMVAAGLPIPRHNHAAVVTHLALDIRAYFERGVFLEGHPLNCRIGINSGPITAGVIERKKISFNVWGDTVNTASRMQSHGVPGQIQVSENTYELIKADFVCEPRGAINVKGKGEMEVWLVISAKENR